MECVGQQVQACLATKGTISAMGGHVSGGGRGIVAPALDGDKSGYGREKERLFRKVVGVDAVTHNIIKFTTALASDNAAARAGILEAGGAVLVLTAFANDDFTLPNLLCLTKQGKRKTVNFAKKEPTPAPVSLSAINAEASTLSLLIYQPVFRAGWEIPKLQMRLTVCALLVNTLFAHPASSVDGRYDVTGALFKKIIDARV